MKDVIGTPEQTPGRGGRLLRNLGYFATGGMVTRLVAIALVPLYARKLGPSGYGTVEIIISTVGLLFPILSLTLYEGVFRFVMKKTFDDQTVLTTAFVMAMLATALGFGAFLAAAEYVPSLSGYVAFVVVLITSDIIRSLLAQFMRATGDVRGFVLGGVLEALAAAVVGLGALYVLGMGVSGYVLGLATGHLVSIMFSFFRVKIWRELDPRKISWRTGKLLAAFCFPLVINGVLWWVINSLNRVFIAAHQGMAEVGVFGVATKVGGVLAAVIIVFNQAWQTSANEEYESRDFAEYSSSVFNVFHLFVFGATLILSSIAAPFTVSIFGAAFAEAAQLIPLVVLSAALAGSAAFVTALHMARMKTRSILWTSLVAAFVVVAANLILVPTTGALGAAVASVVGFGVLVVSRLVTLLNVVSGSSRLRFGAGVFVVLLAMTPITFNLGGGVYATGCLWLGLFLLLIVFSDGSSRSWSGRGRCGVGNRS